MIQVPPAISKMLFHWLIRHRIQFLSSSINFSCIMWEEKSEPTSICTFSSSKDVILFQATHTETNNFYIMLQLWCQNNHTHFQRFNCRLAKTHSESSTTRLCEVTNNHQIQHALLVWFMTTVSLQSNSVQIHVRCNWIISHLENRISQSGVLNTAQMSILCSTKCPEMKDMAGDPVKRPKPTMCWSVSQPLLTSSAYLWLSAPSPWVPTEDVNL